MSTEQKLGISSRQAGQLDTEEEGRYHSSKRLSSAGISVWVYFPTKNIPTLKSVACIRWS